MEARFCASCGAGVPAGAQFCPQCGTKVAPPITPPPVIPAPAPIPATSLAAPAKRSNLVWVPIALIVIALLGWAVLAGLPFRGPKTPRQEKLEVVQEAPSRTAPTATITEIRGPIEQQEERSQDPTPEEGSIGESESVSILSRFIASRADFGASANCVSISSEGYRNRGYTLSARNTCDDSSLGRWRVDTLTGKVYRQRQDGRFLDP